MRFRLTQYPQVVEQPSPNLLDRDMPGRSELLHRSPCVSGAKGSSGAKANKPSVFVRIWSVGIATERALPLSPRSTAGLNGS